ncbi:alpha-1,2-fucosyltransferase [Priestia megaterium]
MIIVKVIGGLGNQMFQIAFAKALALEYSEEIYLDCSAYDKYKIRDFSSNNLEIEKSVKYIDEAFLSNTTRQYLLLFQKLYHVYQKVVKRNQRIGEGSYRLLSKRGLFFNFDSFYYDSLYTDNDIKCVYGYFQSEKYFKKYECEIKKELKVKTPLTEKETEVIEEIQSCNAVALSMRLGEDYLASKTLNVCNEEYYYKAMDYIYTHQKNVVFYIFSDKVDKVKENFKFKYPVRYIEGFKDYESLRIMYSCQHFIISNSSFSWWGAYLSENPHKTIVAPNRWYNNSKKKPDIYFNDMVLLDV